MKRHLLLILTLCWVSLHARVYWQPAITNYSRHVYGASNQNWMVTQHPNGWMYFANNEGLLEFDGVYWNLYPVRLETKLRSVRVAPDGRIYVGGQREFGYFRPDHRGGLSYVSLSARLPRKDVSNIWNIIIDGGRVYFLGDRTIYYLERHRLRRLMCRDGIACSAVFRHQLYIANWRGISTVSHGQTHLLPGSKVFGGMDVVAMLPYRGQLLVVTAARGLYLYDGQRFRQRVTRDEASLARSRVACASLLDDRLALGTTLDGLLMVDMTSGEVERLSMVNGMQNKSVLSVAFDRDRNLWLGLDNGIDYVSLNTPLTFFSSRYTPIGAGYCSAYYRGLLYLGTNQGIYTSPSSDSGEGGEGQVALLPGASGQVHCMTVADGRLFCGGRTFFLMVDGGEVTRYDARGIWNLQPLPSRDDVLLAGSYWGLRLMLRKEGRWVLGPQVQGLRMSAKSMLVEPGGQTVWLANKADGICRVTLSADLRRAVRVRRYNGPSLPVGSNVCIARVNSETVVATRHGLFRYNAMTDRLERYADLERRLAGASAYTYLMEDAHHNIWYVVDGALRILHFDEWNHTYSRRGSRSFLGDFLIRDFENVNLGHDGRAVIGTEDGFARLDLSHPHRQLSPLHVQIRKVYLTNGRASQVYGRSYVYGREPLDIAYRDNSLKIEYGADNFDPAQTIFYSYRLEGLKGATWSRYGRATSKEYTDLPEGTYTFYVRVVTDGSARPVITSITFRVLPPAYRSWWAYTLYALAVAGLLYYLYDRYQRGRRQLIRSKEEELKQQKHQFEQDIDRKERQIDRLEEEKLRSELIYKSDQLAMTTLNIVRKNEMLQKIRSEAEALGRTVSEGNMVGVRRGMLRLINQIDTNIEHDDDLKQFSTAFDAVHHDFFKMLERRYPELSHKDRMLCAYIKMKLMSKEIAPLLNISVRGVEISRYRLRRKLGLGEKESLSQFLQQLAE